jgi:hypothetical protein
MERSVFRNSLRVELLGGAYLRSSGRTIAVGIVNRIIGQDQN